MMNANSKNQLSKVELRKILKYKNGQLFWKVNWRKGLKGKRAGTLRKDGRRQIRVHGKIYSEHRLIFLYHHGYILKRITHIDGNKLNNRIENLR